MRGSHRIYGGKDESYSGCLFLNSFSRNPFRGPNGFSRCFVGQCIQSLYCYSVSWTRSYSHFFFMLHVPSVPLLTSLTFLTAQLPSQGQGCVFDLLYLSSRFKIRSQRKERMCWERQREIVWPEAVGSLCPAEKGEELDLTSMKKEKQREWKWRRRRRRGQKGSREMKKKQRKITSECHLFPFIHLTVCQEEEEGRESWPVLL